MTLNNKNTYSNYVNLMNEVKKSSMPNFAQQTTCNMTIYSHFTRGSPPSLGMTS